MKKKHDIVNSIFFPKLAFKLTKFNKMKSKLFFAGLLVFSITSCSSWKHTNRVSAIDDSRIALSNEVAVDVKVDLEKVVRSNSRKHSSIKAAKDEAMFLAISENNIHIVVDPIYSIQSTRGLFGTKHYASLTGFAGYYVNARSQKEVDDIAASKKEAEDQAAFERALNNFKEMKSFNSTVSTKTKEFIGQKECKDCPSGKAVTKTTSAQEYFKLVESLK